MKIAVVVGHSKTKVGRVNKELNISEYELNEELAKEIVKVLKDFKIDAVLVYRNKSYSQLPNDVNKTNCDYFISVHHNGFDDKSVNGTETLHWWKSKTSKKMAQYINDEMVKVLGYKDRGLKAIKKGHNGWPLLKRTKMAGVLIEPYFTSNDKAVLERQPQVLAMRIVNGCLKFLNDTNPRWLKY